MDIAPGAYAMLPGAGTLPGAAPSGDGSFAQVLAQASTPEAAAIAAPGASGQALALAPALTPALAPTMAPTLAPTMALAPAMAAPPAAPALAEVPATPAALPMAAPAPVPVPTPGAPKPALPPGPASMAQPAPSNDQLILEATPAEPQAAAPPLIAVATDAPATTQDTDAPAETAATTPDATAATPTPSVGQAPVPVSPPGAPVTAEANALAAPSPRRAAAGLASEARVMVEPAAGQLQATPTRGAPAQTTAPQHTPETDQPGTGAAPPQAAAPGPAPAPEAAIASPGLAALSPVDARRPGGEAHRTTEAATPIAEHALVQAADSAGAPAATTQGEAPRAPPQAAPARQVTPAVVAVAISGGGRISVTLEPVELGRVEISVERSGDQPQVVILAERPETLALLQRDQRELDRALTQAGLPSEGRALSFGLTGGDAGAGQSQQRRDEAREGPPRGDGAARGVQSRDTNVQAIAPPLRGTLSLLDLAI